MFNLFPQFGVPRQGSTSPVYGPQPMTGGFSADPLDNLGFALTGVLGPSLDTGNGDAESLLSALTGFTPSPPAPTSQPVDRVLAALNASGTVPGATLEGMFPTTGYPQTSASDYAIDPYSGSPDAQTRMAMAFEAVNSQDSQNAQAEQAAIDSIMAQAQSGWAQPSPSMMNDPAVQAGLADIDRTLASIQGLADRETGQLAALGQSPEYYAALTGGGTGAQNARFERMLDPRWTKAAAAQSLANDPQFGHLFQGTDPRGTSYDLGGASMTHFGGSPDPASGGEAPFVLDDAYLNQVAEQRKQEDAARFMARYGREPSAADLMDDPLRVGRVKFQSEEDKQRFLESRAANEAERAQRSEDFYNPLTISLLDPASRLKYMGDWNAQQGKNRQAAAQFELEKLRTNWDIDAQQKELELRELGYTNEQARWQAQNDLAERELELKERVAEQELAALKAKAMNEGRLTDRDVVEFLGSEAAQAMGGPQAALETLRQSGIRLPENIRGGAASGPTYPTSTTSPGGDASPIFRRRLTPEQSDKLSKMTPPQQVQYLRDNGWTDPQIEARLRETQPGRFGVSINSPTGSSKLYETLKFNPMYPMMWDDLLLGGAAQEAYFPGYDPARARTEFRNSFQ